VRAFVDGAFFVFAGVSAVWLSLLLLQESLSLSPRLLLLVVFWALVAYLVLPRLHRMLTHLYLPDYFIGRARTSDGLLGDPVNLALRGDEAQVHEAMTRAGWIRADDVNLSSSWRIVATTASRRSYPAAPVSPLTLFDRQQDFAYQQEAEGNPAKRHHVRFWACPEGWMLPGGHDVDWLAAGSYDRSVGLSLLTFQVTHRIAPDIDAERDHIVETVTRADPTVRVDVIRDFSTGYHARNGGGDRIETDGDLPVVDVRAAAAPSPPSPAAELATGRRPPPPTAFASAVGCLRGGLSLLFALLLQVSPEGLDLLPVAEKSDIGVAGAATALAVSGVLDIVLAVLTYRGQDLVRILLMTHCALTVIVAFLAEVDRGERPTLSAGLVNVALGILVMLALSSRRSRDYATRDRAVVAA